MYWNGAYGSLVMWLVGWMDHYYTTVPERKYVKIYPGTALDCVTFSCDQFYENFKDRFVDIGLITYIL